MKSNLEIAREIRMAISNGVTEQYTEQQLSDAISAAQQPLVEAGKKMRLSCGIAEDCMEWDAELAKVKEGK